MIIDCDRCEVRGDACGSCVIGVLMDVHEDDRPIPYLPVDLPGTGPERAPAAEAPSGPVARPVLRQAVGGPAAGPVEFAEPERRALQVLAEQGLIPHLRLIETGAAGPERAAAPLMPVPEVPARQPRHRDVG